MTKQKTKVEVSIEVKEHCIGILDKEIYELQVAIRQVKYQLNRLSEIQRKHKATIGKLYELKRKLQ